MIADQVPIVGRDARVDRLDIGRSSSQNLAERRSRTEYLLGKLDIFGHLFDTLDHEPTVTAHEMSLHDMISNQSGHTYQPRPYDHPNEGSPETRYS